MFQFSSVEVDVPSSEVPRCRICKGLGLVNDNPSIIRDMNLPMPSVFEAGLSLSEVLLMSIFSISKPVVLATKKW